VPIPIAGRVSITLIGRSITLISSVITADRGLVPGGRRTVTPVALVVAVLTFHVAFVGDVVALFGVRVALSRLDVAFVGDVVALFGVRVALSRFHVAFVGDVVALFGVRVALPGLDVAFVGDMITFLGDTISALGVRVALLILGPPIARGIGPGTVPRRLPLRCAGARILVVQDARPQRLPLSTRGPKPSP
jgi:hypothetical protein